MEKVETVTNCNQLKLFKHQQELINKNEPKMLLSWECGTGKTLTAIKLIEQKTKDAIIICPKNLVENWKREIEKFKEKEVDYLIISKEQFKIKFKKGEIPTKTALIVDECHTVSIPSSQICKAVTKYVQKNKIKYVYLLSATPIPSSVWSIYTYAKLLSINWNYKDFKNHFFEMKQMGSRLIPVQRKGIEKEVANLVRQLGSTKSLEECIDVPPSIFMNEFFELTAGQKRAIKGLDYVQPIIAYTLEHEICGGTLHNEIFENEKSKRIVEMAEEHKKMIVVCRYNAELNMLALLLTAKYKVLVLNGATENPQATIDTAEKSEACILLVNARCSAGYNLPSFNFMVFYSLDFSLVNYIQILGRIQRINSPHKCIYTHFVIKDTIDEAVYNSIARKEDFDISIYCRKQRRL